MNNGSGSAQVARFGVYEADLQTGELRKNGIKIPLQGQPFQVFVILLQNSGQLVTREELRKQLWPEDTFVDFDHGLNTAITKIRTALGDTAENPRFVETLPRRGYRFLVPVNWQTISPNVAVPPAAPAQPPSVRETSAAGIPESSDSGMAAGLLARRKKNLLTAIALVVVAGAGLGFAYYRWVFQPSKTHALTEKDTIVLADFTNTTGDPVFDGTLRQGLIVQLEQSPFLSLVPDLRIHETLRLMGQPADAKLTLEISREVCRRTDSKAVIEGSILQMGAQYSLILRAETCVSGEVLASTESRANDKSHVLDALGKAASELRKKLGESLSTVQKLDMPLDQATTPSLEALQALSFGERATTMEASVSSYQRAIQLDPNFAMAYAALGRMYFFSGKRDLAVENLQRAYALREHVSKLERFYIESTYYENALGDIEKLGPIYELWAQLYPGDVLPRARLGDIYTNLGQYDKAVEQWRAVLRLRQNGGIYSALVEDLLYSDRIAEAEAAINEAQAKNYDFSELHNQAHTIAFLHNDAAGMAEQVRWFAGKPDEDWMLAREANVAAYSGQLRKAREFSRQAVTVAERRGLLKVFASSHTAEAALREALFGNVTEARQGAAKALARSPEGYEGYRAALALGIVGDTTRAQVLIDDWDKRSPEDTIKKFNYMPTLRAQVALKRNDPAKAIELLELAEPYELGNCALYPAYLRGQAYLAAYQAAKAVAEFQKILDHRGLVNNMAIGALARLQIGRAYMMQGDTAKARKAYQDFLTLWKDADPDIPILIAAKAEYAKLH